MMSNCVCSLPRISICLLFALPAFAQTPGTGAMEGTVYDPSGRTVAKANISIANDATHVSRLVVTNIEGVFVAPLPVPGPTFAPSFST